MIGMDFRAPVAIVLIGPGFPGLSAAAALAQPAPVIYYLGRGVGGRVATRRVSLPDGTQLQFDHGAQFATAKGVGFAAVLGTLQTAGLAAEWSTGGGRSQIVGVPAMSSLARGIAQDAGVQIVHNAAAISVRQEGGLWCITFADGNIVQAYRVILTVPAPQLAALLGPDHGAVRAAASVQMQPCLTLMAAARAPGPFVAARDDTQDLAWIAQDNSKFGRAVDGLTTWVAQANLSFSLDLLE
jgi:renalase